ncbi:MAG: penicillin-binding protein activator LpoB [Pseudomonadota bacterium]
MTSRIALIAVAAALLVSCATDQAGSRVDNSAGRATVYENPNSAGPISGLGIQSNDIASMTDKMVRSMLANPQLAGRAVPPRVQIDSAKFTNESNSRINKNRITDQLLIELNRAANGRMEFVSVEDTAGVEQIREEKRAGLTDEGTLGMSERVAGVDFFLTARITSQDAVDTASGLTTRDLYIAFKLINAERRTQVWGDSYQYVKSAQDDVIYR